MKIQKFILKTADTLVNLIVLMSLIIAGVYACYALWDNSTIYAAADDVQADMLKLKPQVKGAVGGPSFEDLLAINPDVKAWLTMDETNIDYPVLQGETNLTYINTDVYGNFALAGSIYLDSRNDGNFNDTYSLLYGHYMDQDKMFGNLELYKTEKFFRENTSGTLLLPDKIYNLETYAVLLVTSSEDHIFEPTQWNGENVNGLIEFVNNNSIFINEDIKEKIEQSEFNDLKFLSLTTCSGEFTDARTVVLTIMEDVSNSGIVQR